MKYQLFSIKKKQKNLEFGHLVAMANKALHWKNTF
jgi:hypothetical protein